MSVGEISKPCLLSPFLCVARLNELNVSSFILIFMPTCLFARKSVLYKYILVAILLSSFLQNERVLTERQVVGEIECYRTNKHTAYSMNKSIITRKHNFCHLSKINQAINTVQPDNSVTISFASHPSEHGQDP